MLTYEQIQGEMLLTSARDLPDYDPNMTFKEIKALLRRKDILNDIIEQAEQDRNRGGTDNDSNN